MELSLYTTMPLSELPMELSTLSTDMPTLLMHLPQENWRSISTVMMPHHLMLLTGFLLLVLSTLTVNMTGLSSPTTYHQLSSYWPVMSPHSNQPIRPLFLLNVCQWDSPASKPLSQFTKETIVYMNLMSASLKWPNQLPSRSYTNKPCKFDSYIWEVEGCIILTTAMKYWTLLFVNGLCW